MPAPAGLGALDIAHQVDAGAPAAALLYLMLLRKHAPAFGIDATLADAQGRELGDCRKEAAHFLAPAFAVDAMEAIFLVEDLDLTRRVVELGQVETRRKNFFF